jgi:flavodoxin
MKALVIYDTVKGNTAKIAQAIAAGIGGNTEAVKVGSAGAGALKGIDILVIGSPTMGGRPTPSIQAFIDGISKETIEKAGFAAFDTRLSWKFLKIFKYAGDRITTVLMERRGRILAQPEGFTVKSANGPLADGELERAKLWGQKLRAP